MARAERAAVQQEIADLTAERGAAAEFVAAYTPTMSACEKCHAIRAQRPKRTPPFPPPLSLTHSL